MRWEQKAQEEKRYRYISVTVSLWQKGRQYLCPGSERKHWPKRSGRIWWRTGQTQYYRIVTLCVWISMNRLRIDCINVMYLYICHVCMCWAKQCIVNYYPYVMKMSLLRWKELAPHVLIYCITELLLRITDSGQFTRLFMYRVLPATQVQLDLEVPRERKYVSWSMSLES